MTQQKINGILLVNKPINKTSNAVLQTVKRLYGAKKAGHTGSLDPLATGMLPIFFGEATKFCQYILDADKAYHAQGLLGKLTTTSDSQGEIIESHDISHIDNNMLMNAIYNFIGQYQQSPSIYSALKVNGKPMYHYARQGIPIEKKTRTIEIKDITIDLIKLPYFDIRVKCSKGTYIRTLIEDIGIHLKVGAYLTQLHRLYSEPFETDEMYSISEIEKMDDNSKTALLLPIDRALMQFDSLIVNDDTIQQLQQGKTPILNNLQHDALYKLYNENNEFIGLVQSIHNTLKVSRLLSF